MQEINSGKWKYHIDLDNYATRYYILGVSGGIFIISLFLRNLLKINNE